MNKFDVSTEHMHTHTHAHALNTHTNTNTHAHAHTHTHTHTNLKWRRLRILLMMSNLPTNECQMTSSIQSQLLLPPYCSSQKDAFPVQMVLAPPHCQPPQLQLQRIRYCLHYILQCKNFCPYVLPRVYTLGSTMDKLSSH